jgi:membrane protease YdiL (CAAX protease family)
MEARDADTDSQPVPRFGWVRLALAFYAGMFGLAWLWREVWQGRSLLFGSPEAALRGVHVGTDVGLGLGVGLLAIALSHAFTRRTRAGARLARALATALGPLRPRDCLVLALASGLGEEAFFRGALQPVLGLLGASVAFALVHFAPRPELRPWSLFALAGGLVLGALFDATGNLVAPVVAHVLLNGVNLLLLGRQFGAGAQRAAWR